MAHKIPIEIIGGEAFIPEEYFHTILTLFEQILTAEQEAIGTADDAKMQAVNIRKDNFLKYIDNYRSLRTAPQTFNQA